MEYSLTTEGLIIQQPSYMLQIQSAFPISQRLQTTAWYIHVTNAAVGKDPMYKKGRGFPILLMAPCFSQSHNIMEFPFGQVGRPTTGRRRQENTFCRLEGLIIPTHGVPLEHRLARDPGTHIWKATSNKKEWDIPYSHEAPYRFTDSEMNAEISAHTNHE